MFNNPLLGVLEKSMDASSLKQKVLSNNIANVNTPGFKKSQVTFQKALEEAVTPKEALKKTNPLHLSGRGNSTQIIQTQKLINTSLRTDGNNVDIDMELAELAQNNLYFNSLTQFLSSQLALLRHSISEGRK